MRRHPDKTVWATFPDASWRAHDREQATFNYPRKVWKKFAGACFKLQIADDVKQRVQWIAPVKYFLAALSVLVATDACAQFKATTPAAPTQFPSGLSCGPLSLWPPERDDDPVNLIYVAPAFKSLPDDKVGPLETLAITHNTVFGRSFTRSEQYTNDYLAQTPDKLEITWKGSLKKKSSAKMTGRLWNESGSNRWFYSELLVEGGGQVRMKLLAGCHPAQPD